MLKTFSTKLDAKVLQMLDQFCELYHCKKSSLVGDILKEGLQKRTEAFELAESIQRGLEEERQGSFYTAEEVERGIFGKKKAGQRLV